MTTTKRMFKIFFLSTVLMIAPVQKSYANTEQTTSWIGAGLCSLVYTPVKTAFALLLGITGGLSMMGTVPAGDTNVSTQIVKWGMFGDWLIRPDHIRNNNPVKFVGTTDNINFVQGERKQFKQYPDNGLSKQYPDSGL